MVDKWFEEHIPRPLFRLLKRIQRRKDMLKKSVYNSLRAFHPVETGYRLSIEEFGAFEIAFRKGTADERVLAHSFDHDIYFQSLPDYTPQGGHNIIDIGAHIGTFSLLASSRTATGRVFAIEPCLETYCLLKINIALNNANNVHASHIALSGEDRTVRLNYSIGNWEHSIMKKHSSQGEDVRGVTLGRFMSDHSITRCDFARFNCEGAEFPVLLGATFEVLSKIDRMLILYHEDLATNYGVDDLVRHLEDSDFKVSFLNRTRERGWLVAQQRSVAR